MENKVVTIKDMAKKAGVSVSTVSRAFNNYNDISKATRENIFRIAAEIGYKPNVTGKSLDSNHTFRLGMFVEDYEPSGLVNPIVFEILMSFKNTIAKQGYELVLLSTSSDMQKCKNLTKFFKEKELDGAFILGLKTTDDYYMELSKIDYPCVLFDINIQNPMVCCIGVDNIKGAFIAVEHLIKLGHRRIAFINGHKEAFVSYERMDGYYLALNRYGIPIDNNLIVNADFTDKGAEIAIEKLIKENKDITAVFCASDLMAVGAINMINSLGYTVPDDISIVGFDDIYIAQFMTPKLTTVRQNRQRIGENAANVLINLVNGRSIGRSLVEPELIVRESTKGLKQI